MGRHSAPRPPRTTSRQVFTGALVASSASAGLFVAPPAAAEEAPPTSPEEISSPPVQTDPPVTFYVVRDGDWLSKVAPRFGMTTSDIYLSNFETIGPDPDLIRPGQRLIVSAPQGSGQGSQPGPAPVAPEVPEQTASSFRTPLAKLFPTQQFKGQAHRGVDWAAPLGTPGFAVADGVVVESGPANGFGLWTIIRSEIDGQTVDFVYGHMNRLYVSEGQQVTAGQQVVVTGNNGLSTGPHLHFEVWAGGRYTGRPVDPNAWLSEYGVE